MSPVDYTTLRMYLMKFPASVKASREGWTASSSSAYTDSHGVVYLPIRAIDDAPTTYHISSWGLHEWLQVEFPSVISVITRVEVHKRPFFAHRSFVSIQFFSILGETVPKLS